MKIFSYVGFSLVLCWLLIGCRGALGPMVVEDSEPVTTKLTVELPEQAFMDFANDFAIKAIEASPLQASFTYGDLEARGLGDLLYELDDVTLEGMEASMVALEEFDLAFSAYNRKDLSKEEQKIYDMLAFQLEVALEGGDYLLYSNNFNPSFGLQIAMPLTLAQIELESTTEVEAYLSRLEKLPILLQQALAIEKEKEGQKLLLPKEVYLTSIDQINDLVATDPKALILYTSFEARIDALDFIGEEEKETYLDRCLQIIVNKVQPSFAQLALDLGTIAAKDDNQVGTKEWANSDAYYEWLLYSQTSYRWTIKEMKTWLSEEELVARRALEGYLKNHPNLYSKMTTLDDYTFETLEEANRASEAIYKRHFMDYGIDLAKEAVIPSYLEPYVPGGFYFVTSIDQEDYGTMYLPKASYSNLDIEDVTTLLHENVPGHHLYFSVLYGNQAPFIQKMSDWDSYSEGWAVYVQAYSFEALDMDEEVATYYDLYRRYSYIKEMQRDMAIHVEGQSKEAIIEAMIEEGYPRDGAEKTYNRLLANPTEVYKYYYAFMKIDGYRQAFEAAQGADFDEKIFHDFMLQQINIPFETIDQLVVETLADK